MDEVRPELDKINNFLDEKFGRGENKIKDLYDEKTEAHLGEIEAFLEKL